MSVKIRLARHGRKKRPFYRIVVADSRSPRDGRFIEVLGTYNPIQNPVRVSVDQSKAFRWLGEGAEMSTTVKSIFQKSGVLSRFAAARGGEELRDEEKKVVLEIFGHELDGHGSKRKGKRKVATGPADEATPVEAAGGTESPAEPAGESSAAEAPAETAPETPAEGGESSAESAAGDEEKSSDE